MVLHNLFFLKGFSLLKLTWFLLETFRFDSIDWWSRRILLRVDNFHLTTEIGSKLSDHIVYLLI